MRIAPRQGAGVVTAELVDVSAGGLRARTPLPSRHPAGERVEVEIRLGRESAVQPPADVSLRGMAVIVRVEQGKDGETLDTALRFIGPLDMREPFDKLLVF